MKKRTIMLLAVVLLMLVALLVSMSAGTAEARKTYTLGARVILEPDGDVVRCQLLLNGEPREDPVYFADIPCILTVEDMKTGETTEYPVEIDENGAFRWENQLKSYGTYEISARFQIGVLTVQSPVEQWVYENRPPVAEPRQIALICCYDLFFGRRQGLRLEDYIRDPDDPWNLELQLLDIPRNSTGLSLDGSYLAIEPAKLDATCTFIDVVARDALGREAVFGIKLYAVDLRWVDFMILAVLLYLRRRRWKKDLADGQCMISLWMRPVDLQEPAISLDLLLPLPEVPTNLYDMLQNDLAQDGCSDIRAECDWQNQDPDRVKEVLDSAWRDLQNYKISCTRQKDGTIGLRFRNHLRRTTVLLQKKEQISTRFITDDWLFKIDFAHAPRLN